VALVRVGHTGIHKSLDRTQNQKFRNNLARLIFELSHAKRTIRSKTAKQTPCKILKYSHIQRNRFAGFFPVDPKISRLVMLQFSATFS
jgi:hypothetical protein